METSLQLFRVALYEEHLEEASFLYEQCRSLGRDGEVPWTSLADFQDRLEAHLDALVLGAEPALDVCRRSAAEGNAAELFAIVCVCCRHRRAPLLAELVRTVDLEDANKRRALTDALARELPDVWIESCLNALESGDERLLPILARATAYRRLDVSAVLERRVSSAPDTAMPALLWSIGRAGGEAAAPVLRRLARSDASTIAAHAVHAGLRLHDQQIFDEMLASARQGRGDAVALGLAGGPSVAPLLLELLAAAEPPHDRDVIMALALLGEVSAVRALVETLARDDLAGAAAEALQVMTGASLDETLVIPDEMTEDELFPQELDAYRETGELPRRPDGEPFGTRVRRLSRNPALWQEWLKANATRFARGTRFRFGRPCTPRVLLDCLRSAQFPNAYRAWAAEELLVRYGIALPFETDMRVADQVRVLKGAAQTVDQATAVFEPGRWYFAGQLVS